MRVVSIFVPYGCFIFGIGVYCRKYDIEAEAWKLYGEEFSSVLRRFRKTREYLLILNEKMEELTSHLDIRGYIPMNIDNFYEAKLIGNVAEILGYNRTDANGPDKRVLRVIHRKLRKFGDETENLNLTNVEKIDHYDKLKSHLTVEERNRFKDLGFEYAGYIIHEMIKALSTDDGQTSTLLPSGDNDTQKYTTHDHMVKHSTEAVYENTVDFITVPPDSFRHHKKPNIL